MSNPYGIPGGSDIDYDYSKLSPMLGLIDTDRPDYIGQATGPKKWNERMTHNCAVVYLTGLILGGAYGAFMGLKKAPSAVMKIRLNSILNYSGKYGSATGNYLGVLMLMYAFTEKVIPLVHLDKITSRNDYFGPMICGFTSGCVFKSTAGPRGAIVAGLIGVGVVTAIRFTQNTLLPKLKISKQKSHILLI